jgi:hypothetical protein
VFGRWGYGLGYVIRGMPGLEIAGLCYVTGM